MRLIFSKNQSRRILIMYSTVLHNAEDKAIGRKAVREVLGLGMGPGISGCSYFNYINVNCKLPGVELSEIPDECTSLVVKRFYVDLNYHVAANPSNCEKNKINTDNLDKVLAFSKPVYVYYGYATQSEWTQVLACEVCDGGTNSLDEMKGLKAFFNEHPGITGVILSAFEHNGQFAFENGAGFITEEIGLNDPENKCKCEKPFGSFYALLNGFECGIPKPCALYPCRQ
ncbi:hypothetical protein QTP88_000202 [Uroleucon formosanum]